MLMTICSTCGKKKPANTECECSKDRHKVYDREYRDKDSAEFYNSKAWKSLTNQLKLKQMD